MDLDEDVMKQFIQNPGNDLSRSSIESASLDLLVPISESKPIRLPLPAGDLDSPATWENVNVKLGDLSVGKWDFPGVEYIPSLIVTS